jgi:hypothetical protein
MHHVHSFQQAYVDRAALLGCLQELLYPVVVGYCLCSGSFAAVCPYWCSQREVSDGEPVHTLSSTVYFAALCGIRRTTLCLVGEGHTLDSDTASLACFHHIILAASC